MNVTTPRFTVIVPAYNVENEIERALKSLTDCLTDEFELIVVNDESTDDTPARIDKALLDAKCPARRVDIEHAGVSVARNEGLRLAKGEYVAFIDSDDTVAPEYASALLEFTHERKPDALFFGFDSDFYNVRPLKQTILGVSGEEVIVRYCRNSEFSIHHCAGSYNREFLEREQIRYTPGCRISQDIEFIHKLLVRTHSVDIYPTKLYIYLYRESSTVNNYRPYWFDNQDAMLRVVDYAVASDATAPTIETLALIAVYYFFWLRARSIRLSHMSLRELNREVETNYPGQTKRVRECARKYLSPFHINRLAMLAYSISPSATFALLRIIRPEFFCEVHE